MAGSINKVILIGHLGRDPEVRRNTNGDPIVNFSIATSESWRDKSSGERKEKTEWHNIVIFNEAICKVAETYLKKGHKVYVEGQMQTRKYTDKSGTERYSTEVVLTKFRGELALLEGKEGSGSRPAPASQDDYGSTKTRSSPSAANGRTGDIIDDSIPF